MKKIAIDFKKLDTNEKFYNYISKQLDCPDWFGRNADALRDVLTDYRKDELEINVLNTAEAGDWTKPVVAALSDCECVRFAEQMKRSDFWYDLPEELIAQTPIEPRNHSRMLKVDKTSGEIEHSRFFDLGKYFKKFLALSVKFVYNGNADPKFERRDFLCPLEKLESAAAFRPLPVICRVLA